jgi:hypothetical protein
MAAVDATRTSHLPRPFEAVERDEQLVEKKEVKGKTRVRSAWSCLLIVPQLGRHKTQQLGAEVHDLSMVVTVLLELFEQRFCDDF